jgi:hypothetical protein
MKTQMILLFQFFLKYIYTAGWYASHVISLQMELRELLVMKMFWLIFVLFSLTDFENGKEIPDQHRLIEKSLHEIEYEKPLIFYIF